jgi:hypothetical protein
MLQIFTIENNNKLITDLWNCVTETAFNCGRLRNINIIQLEPRKKIDTLFVTACTCITSYYTTPDLFNKLHGMRRTLLQP